MRGRRGRRGGVAAWRVRSPLNPFGPSGNSRTTGRSPRARSWHPRADPGSWTENRFLLTLHMKFWSSAWGFFSHIGGFELAQKPPEMTPHRTRTTPGNFCKLARSYIEFASTDVLWPKAPPSAGSPGLPSPPISHPQLPAKVHPGGVDQNVTIWPQDLQNPLSWS